ncbi:MAG TPA: asparagine synthase (glutamine-hydrolyzing) [Candidatus Brocadiia bacterium]|nr:asparagine synthase (glutamine-hydrolyzing) [Planctomycetota bacterium]MDO8092497.1 asparagine synthase (glutamine-hydrolyzing) [Candidatus Brocadiales bacterium]
MCGITGIYNFKDKNKRVSQETLLNMCSTIRHRGPDDQGIFLDANIALGMRRLSIIDVAGGHQPIPNEDKTIWIVLNGEIYNYLELRERLQEKGHLFSTKSDTEVVIHEYEESGEACVEKLRGMFAFAIWDSKQEKLLIARDRVGIKPLFYTNINGSLIFASELKAILEYPGIKREIDWRAFDAFFTLSYIPAPLTIFKDIYKLLPGHIIVCEKGQIRIEKYWDIYYQPDYKKSEDYFIDGFMGLLEESVKIHLMSEVPLGAFLSGGIDSSTVVSLMARNNNSQVNTFSIGFGGNVGGYNDERHYARLVAQRYHTNQKEFEVKPDFIRLMDELVGAFDEPFADDSVIPSYYVCKLAKEFVTVALSGLGGDELFGGYERYLGFSLSNKYERLPRFVRDRIIAPIINQLPENGNGNYTINHLKRFIRASNLPSDHRYLSYVSMLDDKRRKDLYSRAVQNEVDFSWVTDHLTYYYNSENAQNPLDRVFYQDIKTYLPEDILAVTDRMSMHHSLEVRVPFLDHKLMEFCATIPAEMKIRHLKKKFLLKKGVAHLLPLEIINHKKQGFVGPMSTWLQNDLKGYALEVLSESSLKRHGLFNPKTVSSILEEHFARKETHDTLIWALIVFETWHRMYMK